MLIQCFVCIHIRPESDQFTSVYFRCYQMCALPQASPKSDVVVKRCVNEKNKGLSEICSNHALLHQPLIKKGPLSSTERLSFEIFGNPALTENEFKVPRPE